MELKVFWTDFAKKELKNIYNYHKEIASTRVAKKLVKGIAFETRNLRNFPEMGQAEELLINKKLAFRYLVHQNYKIIYWENTEKSRIEIVDIFDCRKNPIKISRGK